MKANAKTAKLDGDLIRIKFPYDLHLISDIKTLHGRRWHPGNREWSAPISLGNWRKLKAWKFDFCPSLETWYKANIKRKPTTNLKIDLPLYPFQKEGVEFIERNKGRALVSFEMGCGKSLTSLAWLKLHPEIRPVLIVCPASLKLVWDYEILKWLKKQNVQILNGKTPYTITGDFVIINYDIIGSWINEIQQAQFKSIVLDECSAIKSNKANKANRTRSVRYICKSINHIIALSGTPIINRPIEFFNIIQILNKNLFSWKGYTERYCAPEIKHYYGRAIIDYNGAANTEELHNTLCESTMIRRLKKDVLKELPEKTRSLVPLEINRKMYQKAMDNFHKQNTNNKNPAKAMAEIEKIKQEVVKAKLSGAIDWIEDFLESGEKLVIFTTHHFTIDKLKEKFKEQCVIIDGRVDKDKRHENATAFQNNNTIKLLIGHIEVAGVGYTLTAASNVAFMEFSFVPAHHLQAEDRVNRIGQKADSINAYYLVAENTIEKDIVELLNNKAKVLASVLDGKSIEDTGMLTELLERLKKGNKNEK